MSIEEERSFKKLCSEDWRFKDNITLTMNCLNRRIYEARVGVFGKRVGSTLFWNEMQLYRICKKIRAKGVSWLNASIILKKMAKDDKFDQVVAMFGISPKKEYSDYYNFVARW